MPTSAGDSIFFEAVLFDMDGTLVDTEPLWLICETELTGRYGYQWSEADQARCLGGPLDRVGQYMSDLTRSMTPDYFTNTLIALMAEKLHEGAPLMPGAQELVDLFLSLKLPMALVSASPRILVDAVLWNLPASEFEISISSDDVEEVKPHPEGYLKAARALNIPIAKCLILEDSLTGVTAATRSGGNVVAIPHLVYIEETAHLKVVKSLSDLTLPYLKELSREWQVS